MKKSTFHIMKNITLITQIGISMVIPIFAGVYAGNWMDEKLGTRGIFLILMIFLGIGASFLNVYKMVKRDFKNR